MGTILYRVVREGLSELFHETPLYPYNKFALPEASLIEGISSVS